LYRSRGTSTADVLGFLIVNITSGAFLASLGATSVLEVPLFTV